MHLVDRVGDGFGNEALVSAVADGIPFMEFAVADTSLPNNLSGRTPTDSPVHWLTVNNCGPASRALATHLEKQGYDIEPLEALDGTHMLLQTTVDAEKTWIDPTALQYLDRYMVGVRKAQNLLSGDKLADLLPPERILIFRPDEYTTVSEWMAEVVHRYWQTKNLAFYALAGELTSHQLGYMSNIISFIPRSQMEDYFRSKFDPNNFEPSVDFESGTRYYEQNQDRYRRWQRGESPRHSYSR